MGVRTENWVETLAFEKTSLKVTQITRGMGPNQKQPFQTLPGKGVAKRNAGTQIWGGISALRDVFEKCQCSVEMLSVPTMTCNHHQTTNHVYCRTRSSGGGLPPDRIA